MLIKTKKKNHIRLNKINQEITAKEVRLTGLQGEQMGIVSIKEAIKKAETFGLDLVEIAPNTVPPVCKIMNYGKFIYRKNKLIKKQKKKQKLFQVKEIKFRPNTNEGDYQTKLKKLIKFLKHGDKTKITVRFRGREVTHKKIGLNMLNRIQKDLESYSNTEMFSSKIENRQIVMILSPKSKKLK
ncbi:translation initiation factor IF-3 [Candidatus Riesia pediculicola]|uniref:Translation initiation factor IF-3 n=1 Tax=Riesia pediculicola (strain USDA) TaxID=515618 RepID=D4G7Q7_RIEPU|nr:translation initiation factor IF-3 [Candidatus Riesia pediculicola]ADD79898.1 translation initiation factor IF-3 [Candidatus Riesia pediculicola USDA]ARC53629.1 translation initiation factor IF-3 [Candidatus Riesia pediculicola]QOJ86280.1 translation initiation factor IF-3 [Candidatus Riesia pediculicola]